MKLEPFGSLIVIFIVVRPVLRFWKPGETISSIVTDEMLKPAVAPVSARMACGIVSSLA